jgi:hypothetical protein
MTEYVSRKSLTPDQREERLAKQRADARMAMEEHENALRTFFENRDRLKALRLAREAQHHKMVR